MFMAQLDGAVVALALPAMARSFGVGPVELTVGITVYLLVQVIFLPAGSWIADRFGAKRVFAAAMAVFTLASIMCALSHSLAAFVAVASVVGCHESSSGGDPGATPSASAAASASAAPSGSSSSAPAASGSSAADDTTDPAAELPAPDARLRWTRLPA